MFEVDLGKIRFEWKGAWSATTDYEINDVVSISGSTYVAVATSTGISPIDAVSGVAPPVWSTMALGSDLGSLAASPGDLFYYNGTEFKRLAAGGSGQVLKMGVNSNPQWTDPDLTAPIIQTKTFIDYTRADIGASGKYYFGQATNACSITPRRVGSIIRIKFDLMGEISDHDQRGFVEYSKDGGTTWEWFRYSSNNQSYHFKLNAFETDYNSTPGQVSFTLADKFITTNPICFRLHTDVAVTYNGARSSSYEHGQSTITIEELNPDYNTYTYVGGTDGET